MEEKIARPAAGEFGSKTVLIDRDGGRERRRINGAEK